MSEYDELQADRLNEYRALAVYARAYKQAVEAEDPNAEATWGRELNAALARVRRAETRIQVEAAI